MSYVVSVQRDEVDIDPDEIAALAARDPELTWHLDEQVPDSGVLEWRPSGDPAPRTFGWEDGRIYTPTTPSHAELRKLGEIAAMLGASLIGEEGERIEASDIPDGEPELPRLGCLVAPAVVVAILAAIYWIFGGG